MKLIVQIPCYNEAETIGTTIKAVPARIDGVDLIERLVIDDGSTDNTSEVARRHGVEHVVRFPKNKGLACAFKAGLDECLRNGADIIVNTDADNQYNADDIPALIRPILEGKAEIVIGSRPISAIKHFSFFKKVLQKVGSRVVRMASKTDVLDAPSGFRAMSRNAAMSLNVFNDYTYTLETIIQAGQKNMNIQSVPIRTNEYLRPSRLFKSIGSYVKRSIMTILRIFVVYKPFTFFITLGAISLLCGVALGVRYLIFYLAGDGGGHVQSLILASILFGIGFQLGVVAFLADLLAVNRMLMEDVQMRVRRVEYDIAGEKRESLTGEQRA